MRKLTWLLAAGAACIAVGIGSGPAAAGELGSGAAQSASAAPAGSFAVPDRAEVEAAVLSAMAAAAAQAENRVSRPPPRDVAATTTELRTTMIEGARREVSRRWPGTVYIPETPVGAEAFKVCLGRLGCWNVKISIHIDPA